MKVISTPEVKVYFNELVTILYEKGYFGTKIYSKQYVDALIDDIEKNLPTRTHRDAPSYFDRYGKEMEYAIFKKNNKRTEWYVFFTTYFDDGEEVYLIRFIANNHTVAQYF